MANKPLTSEIVNAKGRELRDKMSMRIISQDGRAGDVTQIPKDELVSLALSCGLDRLDKLEGARLQLMMCETCGGKNKHYSDCSDAKPSDEVYSMSSVKIGLAQNDQ